MSSFEEATTTEIFTPQKAKEVVAEFAGMQDLSAFDRAPDKLTNLLDTIEGLDKAPDHMAHYTVDQLHSAAEMVRYFKLDAGRSPYSGLLDDLDLFFEDDYSTDDEPLDEEEDHF